MVWPLASVNSGNGQMGQKGWKHQVWALFKYQNDPDLNNNHWSKIRFFIKLSLKVLILDFILKLFPGDQRLMFCYRKSMKLNDHDTVDTLQSADDDNKQEKQVIKESETVDSVDDDFSSEGNIQENTESTQCHRSDVDH